MVKACREGERERVADVLGARRPSALAAQAPNDSTIPTHVVWMSGLNAWFEAARSRPVT
jgi:hypothetical protein